MTTHLSADALQRAVDVMDRLFAGRRDTYLSMTTGKRVIRKFSKQIWESHLSGDGMVGCYPLLVNGEGETVTRWACVDVDRDKHAPGTALHDASAIVARARHFDIPLHVEITKSRQVHLWAFFADWVPAWQVRAVLRMVFEECGVVETKAKGAGDDETFIHPTCDSMDGKETGSAIWMPLFGRNGPDRQVFVDDSGTPYANQTAYLESIEPITPKHLLSIVEANSLRREIIVPKRVPSPDGDSEKVPAGSLPGLTDAELHSLKKLPPVKAMLEAPERVGYHEWLAFMLHMVPFSNGNALVHRLSASDPTPGRYTYQGCEKQWFHALRLYADDTKQHGPRVSQLIIEHTRAGGRVDIIPLNWKYCVWRGGFARRKRIDGVEQEPMALSNFTMQIVAEEWEDDGEGGRQRHVVVKGMLAGGLPLPESSIPSEDWNNPSVWIPRIWGYKPVIHVPAHEVLRLVSLLHQSVAERIVYRFTGWTKGPSGAPVFLLPQGPITDNEEDRAHMMETSRVSVSDKIDGWFDLPESPSAQDVEGAYDWIETLLDAGDKQVTATLVAAQFLAPLFSTLKPNFNVWLYGKSGHYKSSALAASMNMWGPRFAYDSLPIGWSSSAKRLMDFAFEMRDLPVVIDDYRPETEEMRRSLSTLSYAVGNHQGRERMLRTGIAQGARPIRGLVISTGEDVPHGEGQTARWYIVGVRSNSLNKTQVEEVSRAGAQGLIAPAMRHYLSWLATRINDPEWVQRIRDYHRSLMTEERLTTRGHPRLPGQTAWVKVGLRLAVSSHPRGAWVNERMDRECDEALAKAGLERQAMSHESRLSHRFLNCVMHMVQCGVIRGHGEGISLPPEFRPELFGWRRTASFVPGDGPAEQWVPHFRDARPALQVAHSSGRWWVIIAGPAMLSEIRERYRVTEPITESSRAVAEALVADDYMYKAQDDSFTSELEVNGRRVYGWKIDATEMLRACGFGGPAKPVARPQGGE